MNRDELIDFLLGELPDGEASDVAERLALDEAPKNLRIGGAS